MNVLADIRRYELLSEFANNNEDDEGDFKISSDTKKILLMKMSLNGVFHIDLVIGRAGFTYVWALGQTRQWVIWRYKLVSVGPQIPVGPRPNSSVGHSCVTD